MRWLWHVLVLVQIGCGGKSAATPPTEQDASASLDSDVAQIVVATGSGPAGEGVAPPATGVDLDATQGAPSPDAGSKKKKVGTNSKKKVRK